MSREYPSSYDYESHGKPGYGEDFDVTNDYAAGKGAESYPKKKEIKDGEKGGTYCVMFPDHKTQEAVINFVTKEYGLRYPIKALADDLRPEIGVKFIFNNSAEASKNTLLRILSQRGWHATGEEYFVPEQAYRPARITEQPVPEQRQFKVHPGGRKPAGTKEFEPPRDKAA